MALRTTNQSLFALAIVVLVSSCAALEKQVRQPEVTVGDVRLVAMSLADAQLAFDLDVSNPNPIGLSMRGLSYKLDVHDKSLFDGTIAESLQIAANGTSRVTLPFSVRYEDVIGTLLALHDRRELRYQLSGYVDLGLLRLPYSKTGSFSVPQLPDISVQSLRIDGLSLTGLELGLDLKLSNVNDFPLRFNGLDYELKLAQSTLLQGHTAQPVVVDANGSATMKLKLAVDYASLGNVAQQLRSGQSLPIEFHSQMKIPVPNGEAALPFSWKGNAPLLR
jgi:LEA14-like dessication related protein